MGKHSSCDRKVREAMAKHNWSRDRAEKYVYGGIYNRQHGQKPHHR